MAADEAEALGAEPEALPSRVERFGGRLLDTAGWPDSVREQLHASDLLPWAGRHYLLRVTITSTCPRRHATTENIGIVAPTAKIAESLADGLPKSRAITPCGECGKDAKVTGKSVYWRGPASEWDGTQ